jgi:hypothetical protein
VGGAVWKTLPSGSHRCRRPYARFLTMSMLKNRPEIGVTGSAWPPKCCSTSSRCTFLFIVSKILLPNWVVFRAVRRWAKSWATFPVPPTRSGIAQGARGQAISFLESSTEAESESRYDRQALSVLKALFSGSGRSESTVLLV